MKTPQLILTAFALTLPLAGAKAATNRWDAASGLRPDQMIYRWPLYSSGTAPLPVLSGDRLTFYSTNAYSDNEFYLQSGDMLAMPARLVIEAQVRFVSQATARADRTPACIGFVLQPGVGNGLWIGPDQIFLLKAPDATGGTNAVVDTDGGFHTYRIEVEGLAAGSAVKVYYDGTLTLVGTTYDSVYYNGTEPRVFWGDGTIHASGVAEWRYVWHNAAAVPAVWGVKSYESPFPSGVPATLFNFSENTTAFTSVAPVTLGGSQIDIDALALSPEAALFGFQPRISGGSRLVKIDKSTAAATVLGPVLTNREIRGAVFTPAGRIVALDATQKQIVEVDPTTGQVLGTTPLQVTTGTGVVQDVCDIAQTPSGSFLIAWNYNELYEVDLTTGATRLVFRDPVPDRQGGPPTIAGVAFSRDATNPATLFAYEISLQDDIYTYQTDAGFSRAVPLQHLISSYNSGRGDLATVPPLLCQITGFNGTAQSQILTATFPAGRHAWMEWKGDLSAPSWALLTNSIVPPDPYSGVWSTKATWTISPSLGSQAFFRVASGVNPPTP
jgi:hypothetical protein